MKKLSAIQFFYICTSFALLFSAAPATSTESASTTNAVTIKVGVYENKPKIFTDDSGRVCGFWPQLLEHIAHKENWQIQYVHGSWNENLERLKDGRINVMPDVAFTESRNRIYRFTRNAVLTSWSRVYVRKNDARITSITDLQDKTIAVLTGSVNFSGSGGIKERLQKFNVNCTFLEQDSYKKVFNAVETNKADAGVTNRNFGNKHEDLFNLKKTAIVFQPISVKFALTKGTQTSKRVSEKLDSHLDALLSDNDSVYYQLLETYFESEIARKTVEIFPGWVKSLLESAGVVLAVLVFAVFISWAQVKRKTHEINLKNAALSKSEGHLRTLIETIPDLIWLKDPQGKYLCCNKKFERFFGAKESDIIGKTDYDFVDKALADSFKQKDKIVLASNVPSIIQEEITYADDGHTELLETIKTTMYDHSGNIIGVLGIARDITRLRKNQQAIRREKEFTETALNSQKDTFFLFDPVSCKAIRWNHAFSKITGYTDREIARMKTPDAFLPPRAIEKSHAFNQMVNKTGFGTIEHYLICKNGRQIPMEFNVSTMLDNDTGTKYFIAVGRDLTERRRMEEALRQSHKMESIGTLTGGIAHDFNNILGIILGNAELGLRRLPEQDYSYTKLAKIKTACLRAKEVVNQLLSFSRKSELSRKPTDIAPVIKESIDLIRSSMPSSIEIKAKIPATIDTILADPTHIHQVMINLCANACHAMGERGGILEIILAPACEKNRIPGTAPGKYIQLDIRDNGVGIAPDIREKIFDPYFTTKQMGDGSGMGLSVVHGIVKNHNGHIFVESEPGRGTTVSILFPAITLPPQEKTAISDDIPVKDGKEHILFVDDEACLVEIANEMFTGIGYQITSFTNPSHAFEHFSKDPDQFDLVITDLTMPQMDGIALSQKIKKVRPELPVIICTGNRSFIDGKKAQQAGVNAYLSKPMTIPEISNLISTIL